MLMQFSGLINEDQFFVRIMSVTQLVTSVMLHFFHLQHNVNKCMWYQWLAHMNIT